MSRTNTHIFRVRLRPGVYHEIEIPSEKSLYDLAAVIVRAFDFDLDHAFGFFNKLGRSDDFIAVGLRWWRVGRNPHSSAGAYHNGWRRA